MGTPFVLRYENLPLKCFFFTWSQSKVISFAHCSEGGGHSAAGKTEQTGGKQCSCENSLQIEMVNKNKAVQEEWGSKHPPSDVNTSGQHHLLCHRCKCSARMHSLCSCLFRRRSCYLKQPPAVEPKRECRLDVQLDTVSPPMLTHISTEVQKENIQIHWPTRLHPFMCWI